jgi:hypothetical protein
VPLPHGAEEPGDVLIHPQRDLRFQRLFAGLGDVVPFGRDADGPVQLPAQIGFQIAQTDPLVAAVPVSLAQPGRINSSSITGSNRILCSPERVFDRFVLDSILTPSSSSCK